MIVEKLYEGEAAPRSPMRAGQFRMSMSEACTRRTGYEFLGYPPELSDADDRTAVVMQDGNLHEQDIVRRLLLKGFNIWNFGEGQTWVSTKVGNQVWRGHPDLFIEVDGVTYGLDVKAFRDEVFRREVAGAEEVLPGRYVITDPAIFTEGPFSIMGQMQLYLHSEKARELGITEWIVLIKNKNTAELAECIIPLMPDYLDYVTSRWRGFWGYMTAKRLPGRNFEKGSIECRYCSFRERCWGPLGRLRKRTVELDDPDLVHTAQLWREGKDFEKRATTRLELSKLRFEQAAIQNNSDRIIVDELEIQVNIRSRTSLSTGYVSELLERLRREGALTDDVYNECWDETTYTEVRVADRRKRG